MSGLNERGSGRLAMDIRRELMRRNLEYTVGIGAERARACLDGALKDIENGQWAPAVGRLELVLRKAQMARLAAVKLARMDGEARKRGAHGPEGTPDGNSPAESDPKRS